MAPATPGGAPLPRGPDGGRDGGGAVKPLRGALARLAHAMSQPAAASDRDRGGGSGGGNGDGGAGPFTSVAGAAGLPARVQLAQGGGAAAARCLKMAGVNYFPPACAAAPAAASHRYHSPAAASTSSTTATDTAAAVAPLPRVLAMTSRGQPDSFEEGPSWAWRHLSWGGPVRAKWLYASRRCPEPSARLTAACTHGCTHTRLCRVERCSRAGPAPPWATVMWCRSTTAASP